MDFALQAALLGAVMGSAVLALSTVYGSTLATAPPAYRWWAAAFIAETASKAVLLAGPELVEMSDLMHGAAAVLTMGGFGAYRGVRIIAPAAALGMLAAVAWTLIAQIPRQSLDLLATPLLGLGGIPLVLSGWAFAAETRPRRSDGSGIVALAFAAAGIHELVSPAMQGHRATATWSLLLAQLLAMLLAVALLLLVMRRQQARADEEGERADLLQSRLIDAFGSVEDGMALYDSDDRLLTCNDRYREFLRPVADLLHQGSHFREILAESIRRGVVPAAIGHEEAWLQAVLTEHGDSHAVPREQQYHDGRWVAVSVYPTADGGHLRILRDITSRKQAQQSLEDSVAWLRGIMDTVVDGLITIDDGGTVLSFNPAAERIFGWPAPEVVGRNVKMLMPEPYQSEHDGYLTRYLDTGERRIIGIGREVEGRRRDGSVFPLELAVTEMRQGDMTTFIGMVRDITDRKRVEGALVDSERRFRAQAFQLQAIIDNMAQGVVVFDGNDRLTALNDVSRQMLELDDGAAVPGQTLFHDFLAHFAAGEEEEFEAIGNRLAAIRRQSALVFEHHRPSGTVFEVRSTVMPGGGFILTFTDITERKKHEDALRDAKEAAERGNRAKATFLANISHELRTPLNAIIGFSELMKHEIFGPLEPVSYRHYVDDIHESGMHLLELINDILDMSKAEAGMTDLVESAVDVGAIVRSSVRMMARRAETAHISLAEEVADRLPSLFADERRVRQIVLNLLSNAVKFTEDFGRVTVRAQATADGIMVSVSDTGIGMSAEDLKRVMEPFVQVDTRLSRKYEGTGLGLPLTRALVTAHGGTLTLESAPGVGTTATVLFPASRVMAAEAAAQA
ncbi:MAG: PAS-domain containing protein [Actinomycetota bacterium]